MSGDTDGAQARRHRVEQAALSRIADRMAAQFPELPAADIHLAIQGRYAQFEGSPIRDFVPVLVERSVRADLTGASSG
jgi:hypothetical protein